MAYRFPGASPQKALPGELLLVIHDFEARSNDELSLSKGDRIELIERDDDFGDGWYLGKHTKNGDCGLFPEGVTNAYYLQTQLTIVLVYTTAAPRHTNISRSAVSVSDPVAGEGTDIHTANISTLSGVDQVTTEDATPPPLNTTPPAQKSAPVSNALLPASFLPAPSPAQRSISMVQQEPAEDSPVMNETLSVIDEHMTDMKMPRQNMQELQHLTTNDSGSEYSNFIENRISYIAGQETDEEEHNRLTEKEVLAWSPAQVAEHLEDMGVGARHCDVFREQEISGEVLLAMDQASIFMKEFDLGLVGQRLRTWHKIKALQEEVRSGPRQAQRPKAVFGGDASFDGGESDKSGAVGSPNTTTQFRRASTTPIPVRQDFKDAHTSPSVSLAQYQTRDATSTPSSITFKSGQDSPSRPSAASIRDLNHSRRHSAVDFASTLGPSTPSEQSKTLLTQTNASASSEHKKTPSLDRSWTMGSLFGTSGARPVSAINPNVRISPDRNTFDPLSHRASHVPSSSRDLDRGYRSGDEMDSKKARNLLRRRDAASASHSRQSSYQSDRKRASHVGARRHSRFGSVESIKDTMAAITNPAAKMYHSNSKGGHFRNSSANEAVAMVNSSLADGISPTVTRLEYDTRRSMKLTSPSNREGVAGLLGASKSGTVPSKPKPRIGLRAISDAITSNERSIATSPSSVPSPIKESIHQSPARTGSTTPSGASASLDRESTDVSSKGTTGAHTGLTPTHGTRRKTKKETSAYTRGLEQKTPQEQMIDCDYSGWMKKKSSNIMTTWKPRLFVLRGRRLSYYYADDDIHEKGLIDISSHRVLPADTDIITGIHATVTGAKSSPVSPATSHTPTLAATEAAAEAESSPQKSMEDSTFIFKLVPPRSGLSRAVNFTKPTVHYFAVDNVRQGRLWMAALMKATIDRDVTIPITTSYQLKTISLAKARTMKQRPPALMNLDEQGDRVKDGPKSDETGLHIRGLGLGKEDEDLGNKRTVSLDTLQLRDAPAQHHQPKIPRKD
ncbi:MAG: hypothetical protein Q9163_004258 [Psora crenata]